MFHKQRAEQRGDVQPVGIRIRQNTDLAVTQLAEIFAVRIDTDRHRNIMHLLRGQHFIGGDFPGVKDLALQRHDRLKLAIARLLRRSARGVPFHQEEFGTREILRGAIRQLAGQRRAAGELFTHHFFGSAHAALSAGDRHLRQHFRGLNILVQPQAEGILHHAGDERRALT